MESLLAKLYVLICQLEEHIMPPKIIKLATFIRDYEGKPGDKNYRNNNPGNARWNPTGYLAKYGKVTKSADNFAIFPTYEQGWNYLCNMLLNWAKGGRAEWSIERLMKSYAPTEDDNDPVAYSNHISKQLGVPSSTKLKELLK